MPPKRHFLLRYETRTLTLAALLVAACGVGDSQDISRRCIKITVYESAQAVATDTLIRELDLFAAARDGLMVVRRFPAVSESDRSDLQRLASRHGFDTADLPVVALCDIVVAGAREPQQVVSTVRDALAFTVFTREGCPRCTRAKDWLRGLSRRHPALAVSHRDLGHDTDARLLLANLVRHHKVAAASVPIFSFGGRLEVGFDRAETTGRRLEAMLEAWTCPCPGPIDGSADTAPPPSEHSIDLPWLGPVDPKALGMPLFTLAVGLVDGFNPCAMWVLLLLLAVLVNLQDRLRMLAVACTFIVVSGVAYLAFMAA